MAPPHCTTPCGAYKTKVDKHVLARMSHLQKATGRCRTIQILPRMNSGLSPQKKYTFLLGVSDHKRTPAHAPPPAPRRCEGPDADRRKGWGGGSRDGGCRGEGGPMGPSALSTVLRSVFSVRQCCRGTVCPWSATTQDSAPLRLPCLGPSAQRARVSGQWPKVLRRGSEVGVRTPRTFSFSSQLRGFPGGSSIGPAAGRKE